MSQYYAWHSRIYDATRWAFLFDRDAILSDLHFQPGETVIEIGCGTGRNLSAIVQGVGPTGRVLAVDCAKPMLAKCSRRIRSHAFKNVDLIELEYGQRPLEKAGADVVLLSYSLSMIPNWGQVLECAQRELRPGGRIGVVDFCMENPSKATLAFARWMAVNRVCVDRPYRERLQSLFSPLHSVSRQAFGGLWTFYRFVGQRP